MIASNNGNSHVRDFTNWEDWLNHALQEPKKTVEWRSRISNPERTEFTKTETFEQAVELAKTGWGDGVDRIKNLSSEIQSVICTKIIRPDPRMGECGDEIDIPMYLALEPEHWVEYPLQEMRAIGGKVVSITIDIAMSAACPAVWFENRGAAIIALVDALEQAGYRCEVVFQYSGESDGHSFVMSTPFKIAQEPIELDRFAFVLSHPSTPRRLAFAILENDTHVKLFHPTKIGSVGSKKSFNSDINFDRIESGEIEWLTPESATAEVLRLLKASGLVEIEADAVSV